MISDLRLETPKSLTEMIIARLGQAIVDGEFDLGEAIPEDRLAKAFGVSRTPVRDALAALQRDGLVVIAPKRGSFVFRPTIEDAAAICDYRFLLEREGLRLSLLRAPREAHAAMRAAIDAMAPVRFDDAVAYGRGDTEFHEAFFAHCGNVYLADGYRRVSRRVAALRTHLTARVEERRATSFEEHERMAGFFAAADLDALFSLLDEHIARTRRVYEAVLRAPPRAPPRLAPI